ncbi:LOW QUALITY PROTEIN: putative RNA polymerase II subunit B1 CTD phosphatase RPAP2 [Passer domesticus]|uniref:LOW QUALITY PROTEIN: putative RNA polymerase II subunit B1 CTD phosphatase RPAP2 n=1 Tax=Passer domesticus TaxID=48849 RepID=UPI0030FE6CA5
MERQAAWIKSGGDSPKGAAVTAAGTGEPRWRRAGNQHSAAQKNKDAAQRKADVEAALRNKTECEKKALSVVEQLLEEDITEEFLLNCGKCFTPSHHKDVVDERSVIKLCGYPLCQNKLENVPKQKHKISTKTNKRVYDITKKKCFCSNLCYRASKYFEAQISRSPVWMREEEKPPDTELLKEARSGRSGEEVKLHDEVIKASDIENPRISSDPCESGSHDTASDSSTDTEQDCQSCGSFQLLFQKYSSREFKKFAVFGESLS